MIRFQAVTLDGPRRPLTLLGQTNFTPFAGSFLLILAGLQVTGGASMISQPRFAWLAPIALGVLPAALACFYAAAFALVRRCRFRGYDHVLALATTLALAEWLRGHLFTGFPWNLVGLLLAANDELLQLASIIGIYGLCLFALLILTTPLLAFDPATRRHPALLLTPLALLSAWTWGHHRLAHADAAPVDGVRLRLVQPGILPRVRDDPAQRGSIFAKTLALTRRAGLETVTHVFWPESAVPFRLLDSPKALVEIAAMLPRGATFVTGGVRREADAQVVGGFRVYNSLFVFDQSATLVASYDKQHLVPFGEYLPFEYTLAAIGFPIARYRGGYTAGAASNRLIKIPGLPQVAAAICYEMDFAGDIVPSGLTLEQRPGLILNLTNDSPLGDGLGPREHLLLARVRAVEEGLAVIRPAYTGISAIIDPYGRLVHSVPQGQSGVIDGPLPRALSSTPYARFGDWIFALMLMCCAARLMHSKAIRRLG